MIGRAVPIWRGLRLKWLWLRHVYPFYWAHKPLCQSFEEDVLRLGNMHVCRSCFLAYAGIVVTGICCAVFHGEIAPVVVPLFSVLLILTLVLSLPPWYKHLPRAIRDVARTTMGMAIALVGFLTVLGHWIIAPLGAAILIGFWRFYMRLRRRRRQHACDQCSDLHDGVVCPGFSMQTERLRRYEQTATEFLLSTGYVPDLPSRR